MFKVIFLLILIISILLILKNKFKTNANFYNKAIFALIFLGFLFFIITSGKLIIPQFLQIIKILLPIATKFIGL